MGLPECTGFQFSECTMELFSGIGSVRTRARSSYSLGARRGRVFSGAGTPPGGLGEIEVAEIAQQRRARWPTSCSARAPIYATSVMPRPSQTGNRRLA
jgi:hypothetical protein